MTETLDSITLRVGQPVPWPKAPHGLAQVEELLRSNVRLVYRTKGGRWRFRLLPAARVAELVRREPPLFELTNPLGRGAGPKSKTYTFDQER